MNTDLYNHILEVYNYLRAAEKHTDLKNVCLFSLHKFKRGLINDIEEVKIILSNISKMQHIYEDLINRGRTLININDIIIGSLFISSESLAGQNEQINLFLKSK